MNTHIQPTEFPHAANDLLAAMLLGDLDRAAQCVRAAEPAAALETAHACMRGRRWSDAAWVFDQIEPRDNASELKRCFCRNLAALQTRRPDVYQTIVTLPAENRVGIGPSANGRPTLIVARGNGERVCLSPGNDPLANVVQTLRNLKPAMDQGLPLGICGIGDGYLLHVLAGHPPQLFMDMQQPVFIIEPDSQILLHCLMIHDYTGPNGPIEQSRFHWFAGVTWREDVKHALLSDHYLPPPAITICQGLTGATVAAALKDLALVAAEREARVKDRVAAYYAEVTREQLANLLGPSPARQPRILLMTTRFSTVLQYSTRDAAEAFEKLGWETRVMIEPSPAHRLMQAATRNELASFKPDVVFQLDHLRYEHGDLFPANLPFVCWVQDHLTNLRTPAAAASIAANDFVLTDSPAMYRSTFGYPQEQCIAMTKLTRLPDPGPQSRGEAGDDLIFVSNASHVPAALLAQRIAAFHGSENGRKLLELAGRRLLDLYRDGGSIATYYESTESLRNTQREIAGPIAVEEFDAIAAWLFHPLNDALYRQQALAWARDAAAKMGFSFALYGSGWEKHPEFATHARGPVQYGADLQSLTRAARFNLQIVPYHCLHQRLMDGLVAGGFYLIRQHCADTAAGDLIDFLLDHAPQARNLPEARAALAETDAAELESLARALLPAIATTAQDDPVEAVRTWRDMGLVVPRQEVLPHLRLTSFVDAATLRRGLARFAADPDLREQIRAAQRQSIENRFSYASGLSRVTARMHELLARPDSRTPPLATNHADARVPQLSRRAV